VAGSALVGAIADLEITGLTSDSRTVEPGNLFAALPGAKVDGRAFIAEAVARGAAGVLAPAGSDISAFDVPGDRPLALLTDDNPRRLFAQLAARFWNGQPGTVAAVTGTNGKTSVADFLRQIWLGGGTPAASLGTLGVITGEHHAAGSLTTPDPAELHRRLADLARQGITHLALEASSHGLDQYRLDGVRLTAAAFTNLSRDHLDYHRSMEDYLLAKSRLFREVMAPGGTAVLNADSDFYPTLCPTCTASGQRVVTYGRKSADIRLDLAQPFAGGQHLDLTLFGAKASVSLPLAGGFQADNALCALGLAVACGMAPERAAAALANLRSVPGRLEHIGRTPGGAPVFVDYAHTPGALATVLDALRPHTHGHLSLVFGCGGERDTGKRPEMGAIAAERADRVIITDDNPRGEDADGIRRQITAACPEARDIGDRQHAIQSAIDELRAEDVLLIAGKGHETGQVVGDQVLAFNDRDVARGVLKALAR